MAGGDASKRRDGQRPGMRSGMRSGAGPRRLLRLGSCVLRVLRAAGIAGVLLVGASACRDPDRAILAGLGEAEQARFMRGRGVAVPCWTCHDLAGDVDKVGPSLVGVFGRRSGMAPDQRGSEALLGAAIVWDERSLSAFLADPSGFVPGNQMVSPGVRSPEALADLIFYLRHVTRPGARSGSGG